jgi:hypothetical protein
MFTASQIVILLFLTRSFTHYICFHLFCSLMGIPCVWYFQLLLNFKKHAKTFVHPLIYYLKATFNISKVSAAFCPCLKQDILFFQVYHFKAYQNRKWDDTYLHITTHYSVITCDTALFQTRTDSADFTLSIPGE